jgi:hypothetical protein
MQLVGCYSGVPDVEDGFPNLLRIANYRVRTAAPELARIVELSLRAHGFGARNLLFLGRAKSRSLASLVMTISRVLSLYSALLSKRWNLRRSPAIKLPMRRPGRSQAGSFSISQARVSSAECRGHHPSIRTLGERLSLGASCVFSFQLALPPVRRPVINSNRCN